jgi:endo-alpha-N-acetylgalactosaminidase
VTATPGARQVAVSAPLNASPGKPFTVHVHLTAGGTQTLPAVQLALQLPQGWTAVPAGPTFFSGVAPGKGVTATFRVTPAAYSPNLTAVVHATAVMGTASRENGVQVTVR